MAPERFGRRGHDEFDDARAWRRTGPRFDDFMSWSVRLARIAGTDVRIHFVYIAFVVVKLLKAAFPATEASAARLSFTIEAGLMAILFVVVLLHEFGHVLACRAVRGSADEILMWPLGGLAQASPPDDWRAHLVTTAGGPLVNLLLVVLLTPLIGLLSGQWLGVALPNPLGVPPIWRFGDSPTMQVLLLVNWVSLVLLLFNLLPIFPMDGGRALQEVLWPRLGYVRSMRLATRIGVGGAVGLAIWGAVSGDWLLIGVALFGGVTCIQMMRQLDYSEAERESADPLERIYAESLEESRREERREAERSAREGQRERQRAAARAAEAKARQAAEEAEFNRILDKIRASGMGSLTSGERHTLERETERRRRG